jgi:hypothetical protein
VPQTVKKWRAPRQVSAAALKRPTILVAVAIVAIAGVVPAWADPGPSIVTQTYGYTGETTTFTVPDGITQLTLTLAGGEGGRGGTDSSGPSPEGGYQGVVTGTISVTPGQVLTIAVGQGGATGDGSTAGSNNPDFYTWGAAAGGQNPLGSYRGGNGGVAGFQGSSGDAGGGGAATVITTADATIVAGRAGGAGGSGQYEPTLGRVPYSTFSARTDTVSTDGQEGITVATVCNNAPYPGCDGGGGGAGGGGATGGAQGDVQFGSESSNEWYGYGGYPGQNSTGGLAGLSAAYQFYPDDSADGSVTISYTTGGPGAPSSVAGVAGDSSVSLTWTAPTQVGQSPISDYVVEYAPASDPTNWATFSDDVSTATSATVSGLTNDTSYVFRVSATNSAGEGPASSPSDQITPAGPPSAPVISSITPGDGTLSVAFSAASSGSPVLRYEYRLNGSGDWIALDDTTSPQLIAGLTNGTQYSVQLRAVSAIGDGAASLAVAANPEAAPGAPSITSVSPGVRSATVSFTAGYSGGGVITDYQYRLNGDPWASGATTTSPLTITGLASGTTYPVTIRAVTANADGAASQTLSVTTADVPDAPVVNSIAAGDGSLTIAFTASNSGGSTVTAYQYQLVSAGDWVTASSLTSPIVVSGLTNGTAYAVRLRAVNAVGAGAGSAAQSATPASVPGAPTIVGNTVAGSDLQLSAAFNPPASDGGSAITTYEYSTDAGATWRARAAGTTASPLVISALSSNGTTPLVNGTTYFVELRAVNGVGAGLASAVATGIAKTTPSTPTITGVTPGPSSLQVTFQPASNGGAAITGYQYRLGSGGSWISTGTLGSTFLITGLTNGTAYAVSVRANNVQGNGAASDAVTGTPVTAPGQPTIAGVVRADRTLTVAVTEASTGGSAITEWDYSTDGGTTWRSAATSSSPLTITTLSSDGSTRIANGTSYPIAVRAVNAAGAGVASAVTVVGPSATPNAPTVTLTPLNQAVQVAFTESSDGGSPISAIEYRLDAGDWVDAGTLSSPFTIASLTNGTAYGVEVRADNAIGAGAASTPAAATPLTVPDAPTAAAASSDTASAEVSWTAPDSDGGSAITGYVASAFATANSTPAVATCSTAATACAITGLTDGTAYYVSVVAQNAAGSSLPSAPRVLVTPLARPDAPSLDSLNAGNALLSLAYTAGSEGSSPITGYQYQLNDGPWQTASLSNPLTISGLVNGTSYTVALRAVSDAGVGTASSTLTATPYTFPDAPNPTTVIANGVHEAAIVSWVAPSDNGSPITGYTATAFSEATAGFQVNSCSTSELTCTITGLSDDTTYYISLQAGNAAGFSARSAPRVAVTPSLLPGAVSTVVGVSGDGQVALSWTAGSTGAFDIVDYTVWYSSGDGYIQFVDDESASTTATVTGLTNGTAYTFVVYAVNSDGTGPASTPSDAVTPLAPGTVPTASDPVSVDGGFTFTITNYSPADEYTFSATNGASVTPDGSSVDVTGLDPGASSAVTVSAARAGYTTTSVIVTGSALLAGIAPTFTAAVRSPDGYSFQITNYVSSALYSFSATNDATVTHFGSSVLVSGVGAGASSDVTVSVSRTGYTDASAVESGAALALGTAPTFSWVTRTASGFTFDISNYSADLVYTFGATNDATITDLGSTIVVSGLAPGASSEVTVTATDPGTSTASASVSGAALLAGLTPTFSAPTQLDGGYSFSITNYSADYTYLVSTSAGASPSPLTGSSVVVSGLAAGASSSTTVVATRIGYADGSATTSGSALAAGTTPTFSVPVRTADGFTFEITNYSADVGYSVDAFDPAAFTRVGADVTVSELRPGRSGFLVVTASRSGFLDASASISGTALLAGVAPVLSAPTRLDGGYSFGITNYSADCSYVVATTLGTSPSPATGSTVVVSGLTPNASASATVTAVCDGYTNASATTSGSSLATGTTPTFSTPVRTTGGFTFEIINYSLDTGYSVDATDPGVVSCAGAVVTVSGLGAGRTASVTVTASREGFVDASASVTGTSKPAPAVPPTTTASPTVTPTDTSAPTDTGTTPSPSDTTVAPTAARHTASPSDEPVTKSAAIPPAIAEQQPGIGTVLLNGVVVNSTVTSTPTSVVLAAHGVTMKVSVMANGHAVAVASDGKITLGEAGSLSVTISGFNVATAATVWGFSTPTLLDRITIGATGSGDGQFALPASMVAGDHTLVVTGTSASGRTVTMALGIVVTATKALTAADSPAPKSHGGGAWWWLIPGAAFAALVLAFVIVWRRRRPVRSGSVDGSKAMLDIG